MAKRKFVHDLHRMLIDLPEFAPTKCDQDVRTSLVTLQKQLKSYCSTNDLNASTSASPPYQPDTLDVAHSLPNIAGQHCDDVSPRTLDHAFQKDIGIQYSPVTVLQVKSLPPPVPPPPPPISELSGSNITRVSDSSSGRESGRYGSLLSDIKNGQIKNSLRNTNVPRTPGGTPIRPKHWVSTGAGDGTHTDLLQRALMKRFRSMRGHSTPKKHGISEHGSIEISNAWSEVGNNTDQYVSDPELTRTSTNITCDCSPCRSAADFEDSVFSPRGDKPFQYSTSI